MYCSKHPQPFFEQYPLEKTPFKGAAGSNASRSFFRSTVRTHYIKSSKKTNHYTIKTSESTCHYAISKSRGS